MKLFEYLFIAILSTILLRNPHLEAHGFGANTQIKLYDSGINQRAKHWHQESECFQGINQIYDYTIDHALKAKSYNLQIDRWSFQSIKKA